MAAPLGWGSNPMTVPPRSRQHLSRLGLLGTLVVAACMPPGGRRWGGDAEDSEGEKERPPVPVVTTTVARGGIQSSFSAASTIEAERKVTVHAESTGRIVLLTVQEGDEVKTGKLLAQIKYEAQVNSLDRAASNLDKTRLEYERVQSLFDKGAAAREQLDSTRIAYDTALIDMKDRQREFRNTKVLAPFSGTITERAVNQGAFVSSGAQILSIVDFDSLVARVYVPERQLDKIQVGQAAQVAGKAASGRKGQGTIERIAPIVDAATGTVKVTVRLPKEVSGGARGFLPGMYAEVTMATDRKDGILLVDKRALVREDEQTYVFMLAGDLVERRRVEIGLQDADRAELLQGPPEGTEIVLLGHGGLKDGAHVRRVDERGQDVGVAAVPAAASAALDSAAASRGGA
jgi:RND family efflux transporter MFP subunit